MRPPQSPPEHPIRLRGTEAVCSISQPNGSGRGRRDVPDRRPQKNELRGPAPEPTKNFYEDTAERPRPSEKARSEKAEEEPLQSARSRSRPFQTVCMLFG